ncbi:hypothetical protein PYCC9005_001410 [Savitreella phatthalungensis]
MSLLEDEARKRKARLSELTRKRLRANVEDEVRSAVKEDPSTRMQYRNFDPETQTATIGYLKPPVGANDSDTVENRVVTLIDEARKDRDDGNSQEEELSEAVHLSVDDRAEVSLCSSTAGADLPMRNKDLKRDLERRRAKFRPLERRRIDEHIRQMMRETARTTEDLSVQVRMNEAAARRT